MKQNQSIYKVPKFFTKTLWQHFILMGRLWYIRHGCTEFNVINNNWHKEGDPQEKAGFQYNEELIDSRLTEDGAKVAYEVREEIWKLGVEKVFVSPMLRALQTCEIIYKDCEQRPEVYVHPILTEWLHVNHDVQRFPNDYRERFGWMNWSLMPETFFVPVILRNSYTERIPSENPCLGLVEIMKNALPEVIESRDELYERAQQAKLFLKDEILAKDIAIVGHSAFFRHFTSTRSESGLFSGERRLANCEFTDCTDYLF